MKFPHQLALSSLAAVVLSGCSGGDDMRRRAVDDYRYLETPALEAWQVPANAQPTFYPEYEIPQGEYSGGIGVQVDIRPPQQILALIPGARFDLSNGEARVWFSDQELAEQLWQNLLALLEQRGIGYAAISSNEIETGWVDWAAEDESTQVSTRYVIKQVTSGNMQGINITLSGWKQPDAQSTPSMTEQERYTVFFANLLTTAYDQKQREEAQRLASQRAQNIPTSVGTDRSGMPVIIARAPYDVVWLKLPELLPQLGLTIEERSQSKGSLEVKYNERDDEYWESLGIEPIELNFKAYTMQLGDLGNRTSITLTNSKGQLVEESTLKTLQQMIAHAQEVKQ